MNDQFLSGLDELEGELLDNTLDDTLPAKRKIHKWEPSLLTDLALRLDTLEDTLAKYNLSQLDYDLLCKNPAFQRDLAKAMRDVNENGLSFVAKARVLGEEYLQELDNIVHDLNTPASTKLEAIKAMIQWGRLLPDKGEAPQQATQVNVNIQL